MAALIFDERYPHEKGFGAHFGKHIAPLLQKMEGDRQRSLTTFTVAAVIWVFLLVFAAVWLVPGLQGASETGQKLRIGALFLLTLGGSAVLRFLFWSYGNRAKKALMPHIVGFFEGAIVYMQTSFMPASELRPFSILPSYDSYKGEDLLVEENVFSSCELKLTETRGSGKNRHTVVTFKGLALKFQLPRKVAAKIVLRPDWGAIGNWFGKFGEDPKVVLEDPVFERLFQVYSQDQIESRRVLQPALMLRLVQFSHLVANWGKDINRLPDGSRPGELPDASLLEGRGFKFSGSFNEDKLLLLVPCAKNLFEPAGLFRSAFDPNEIRCVLYQIHLIRLIIDELRKFPQLTS